MGPGDNTREIKLLAEFDKTGTVKYENLVKLGFSEFGIIELSPKQSQQDRRSNLSVRVNFDSLEAKMNFVNDLLIQAARNPIQTSLLKSEIYPNYSWLQANRPQFLRSISSNCLLCTFALEQRFSARDYPLLRRQIGEDNSCFVIGSEFRTLKEGSVSRSWTVHQILIFHGSEPDLDSLIYLGGLRPGGNRTESDLALECKYCHDIQALGGRIVGADSKYLYLFLPPKMSSTDKTKLLHLLSRISEEFYSIDYKELMVEEAIKEQKLLQIERTL
ncbi:MAG: hypothetical protein HY986_00260 [Candidatus Melainabacteria bacterium]|nr:hypothetical protein [Candidatus Melainabacteria bacterium]